MSKLIQMNSLIDSPSMNWCMSVDGSVGFCVWRRRRVRVMWSFEIRSNL